MKLASRGTIEDTHTEEADKVSANIARLLSERSFAFTFAGLTAVHRRIFEGVFPFAGQIRACNLTKKEWVLRGDTVLYVSAPDVKRAVEYDLEQEHSFDYTRLSRADMVRHFSQFISGLWQIHPFREGNTRTTAVFAIQYLRSMGFDVGNNLFAEHSWYFRNALVRANYQNIQKGIRKETVYLENFFANLLLDERHELKNRYLIVQLPDAIQEEKNTHEEQIPATESMNLSEPVRRLLTVMDHEQFTVKQLMEAMGIKHRPTFVENYLLPAMEQGLVEQAYPDKPKHPRQKYLLTVRGLCLYNDFMSKP